MHIQTKLMASLHPIYPSENFKIKRSLWISYLHLICVNIYEDDDFKFIHYLKSTVLHNQVFA